MPKYSTHERKNIRMQSDVSNSLVFHSFSYHSFITICIMYHSNE